MYSYEEVLNNTLEYFDGDELATNVWITKYALRDNEGNLLEKTPDNMHWRLAKEFARIEKNKFKDPYTEEQIYEMFKNFKYIVPQGSPMYGIGNDYQIVSLSNCYFLEKPIDCYNSILDIDKQLVNISKRRGGVGIDLSNLRPKGSRTHNAAHSSTGIVSWMERYSNSIREVGQNNRRGALMLTLDINHPDIFDFVTVKKDLKKVTGANISVKLSNDFINAVKNDEDFELKFPTYSNSPIISKIIKAKELWNTIIECAYNNAEPGLVMWDNILKGPADCYDEYRSEGLNPSLRSGTLILTNKGPRTIESLENKQFKVYNLQHKYSNATCRLSGKNVELYEIKLNTGFSYFATKEHRWATFNGEKTTLDLQPNDKLPILKKTNIFNGNLGDEDDGFLIGWFLGDGWKTIRKDNNKNQYGFICSEKDHLNGISKKIIRILQEKIGFTGNFIERIRYKSTWYELNTVNKQFDKYMKKFDNPNKKDGISKNAICKMSEAFVRGLINGYLSSDGGIDKKTQRISFVSKNKKLLSDISEILGFYGIKTTLKTNKPHKSSFPNGKNYNKLYQSYCLVINDLDSKQHFAKLFNSDISYKSKELTNIKLTRKKINSPPINYVKVISITKTNIKEDVWDIAVDDKNNCFSLSHCITHNCSEITLSPLDSCRLMCINLFSFVKHPFTKNAELDYDKLYKYAQYTQRLMDDMVDLESEKIDKIIKKIDNDPEPIKVKKQEKNMWLTIKKNNDEGRRTGTGPTAIGDTLAALNIKYGSKESIDIVEKIYRTLKLGCYRSSVDIAKELGHFNCWNSELEKNCEFLLRIKEEDPQLYRDMNKYGRRNIALLTTAPTGSVSLLTQTTSGIEPLFKLEPYIRRRKLTDSDEKPDFIDKTGDKWKNYEVWHSKIKMWMSIAGTDDVTKSSWYKACANDIDWINRVKIQAAAQKHVCHSISSTINLPNNVKKDVIEQIYFEAFNSRCKGITVYRDGCRDGVLISKNNTKFPEERPKELPCDVHHVTIKGQQYFILVGLLDDRPYEVFAGKNGFLPLTIKSGTVIRKRKDFYKAIFDDGDEELSPITATTNEMEECVTRLTSGLLRIGADMHFVVKQLEKVGERQTDMYSFARSVARALKKYIPDGTKEDSLCPECDQNNMVRQDGCAICLACGYSKCL